MHGVIKEMTYRFRKPLAPRLKSGMRHVVIHHTADGNASPEAIHRWHIARGWSGIGYHFVIDKDGVVYRGRPYWARGAHCDGSNNATGVVLVGDFTTTSPTDKQVMALRSLLFFLTAKEGSLTIKRHCDLNPTSCPGRYFPWPINISSDENIHKQRMPLLKRGMSGRAVSVLQTELNERGFRVDVDGKFGAQTEAAVKRFQKKCNMRVDGVVGRKTWAALGYGFSG